MKSLHISFFGVLLSFSIYSVVHAQTTTPKIAVGANQSLVLTDDGTVYTFGSGNYGTLGQGIAGRNDIAAPITHANLGGKKIIASATNKGGSQDSFTILIAEDSTVYSFGANADGQLGHGDTINRRDPTQITHANITGKKFVAVAAGQERSYLLTSDGLVFSIGSNFNGDLGIGSNSPTKVLVPTLIDTTNLSGHKITKLSAGREHMLMLSDSNYVFAIGANSNGQLGNGSAIGSTLAIQIPKANFGNKTLVDIQTGEFNSMALADDGTVYSWGYFASGLGHGTLSADLRTPTALTHANLSGKTITKISKTYDTALMLASDGTVFIFGDRFGNDFGFDLMDYPTVFTSSSTLGKTISDISIGRYHGLILADDGTVYGFGSGIDRSNGVGTPATLNSPRLINDTYTTGKVITQLSAGAGHSIIIDSAGVVYSFGGISNVSDYGNSTINYSLGRSYDRIKRTPTKLTHANISGKKLVDVKAGGYQSFLLTDEGEVFAFGSDFHGQLGTGDSLDVYVPTLIDHTNLTGKKVVDIATSNSTISSSQHAHTLFLTEDGKVFASGSNSAGQLGLGDFNTRLIPTEITHANISGKTIIDISVGAQNSMLIASDGSVFIWGKGGNGEMGYGNSDTLNVPTLATHVNSLGKTFIDGAIGQNSTSSSAFPHFILVASDSSVYSFGENGDGQLGQANKTDNYVPTQISSTNISGKKPIVVKAGESTSMLLMNDGSVFSFGNTHKVGIEGSPFTDFTEPTLLSSSEILGKRITAITTDNVHSLAIRDDGTILSFGSDSHNFYRLGALGNGLPESGDETPQPIANFNWLTSPIPTTNLALHLDAGRGLTTFGDSVNTWADLGSSDNNGIQTNLARRAVAVDSAINNQRAIRFNGVDSYLTLPIASTLGIQNSDYEMFMVAKSANSGINFLMGGQTIGQYELHLNGDAGARFIPTPNASKYVDVGAASDFTDGIAQLINLQATESYGKLTLNRSQTTTNTTDTRSTSDGNIFLGVRTDNSFSFNGDIAEVIIYNGTLSTSDRGKVEEYLVSKYGISNTLSSTFTLTGTEGWRLLASPVADSSFAPLLDNLWTQGFTGAKAESGTSNVFFWDTTTATSDNTNWKALSRMDTTMQPGSAALVYVFSDDNYTEPGDAGFPKTLTVQGIEPLGTQNFASKLNPNTNGFALLGNPFRYDIDWDVVTKGNLSNSVYVYDHNVSGWKSWNGTLGSLTGGVIGAYNGFFVQTQGSSPTLNIPDSAKTYTAEEFLGKQIAKADPSYFSLEFKSESGFTNKAWFQFSEDGDFGIDASDAHQLNPLSTNYVTMASILNDTTHLDINSLPVITESFEIPLVLQTTLSGTSHSITKTDINLAEDWEVSLYDSELDITTDLTEPYVFTMNAEKAKAVESQGLATPPSMASIFQPSKQKQAGARFTLTITPATTVNGEPISDLPKTVELEQNYPNPFNPSSIIQFGVPTTSKIQLDVFDLLGRKVATLIDGESKSAGRYTVQFDGRNLASGLYIYRLQVGKNILTKKMTLIK